MWSLFHAIPATRTREVEGDLGGLLPQEATAYDIFPVSLEGSFKRKDFLTNQEYFDKSIVDIPAELSGVIPFMEEAARLLIVRYIAVQSDATVQRINTPEPYTPIYDPMEKCFLDAVDHAAHDVRLIDDVRTQALQKKAREKKVAPPVTHAQNANGKNGGKRTADDDAADAPTLGPSKRAKLDEVALPALVEDQDMGDQPPSPTAAVHQRAESKKAGLQSSKQSVSFSTWFSTRLKTVLGRTKSK